MEVICQKSSTNGDLSRAPLLFVHGSYHGAWCWACHWMPYFSARGHDCYAISLVGQGASDILSGFSLSLKITLSLMGKLFGSSLSICRKSFFSANMPEANVRKYQQVLKRSSCCRMIDLQNLNDSLPLPRLPAQTLLVCVLAAENDFLVDLEGAQETTEWYGTEALVIGGSAHDIMIDYAWEKAVKALQSWLDGQAL